jgi:hypothetical protein
MLEKKFDDNMIHTIIDASLIYMCACPAQVAKVILDLRQLYNYQQNCLSNGPLNTDVHELIATTVAENHQLMESTLDRILTLENWDRETLEMPKGLRLLRDKILTEM